MKSADEILKEWFGFKMDFGVGYRFTKLDLVSLVEQARREALEEIVKIIETINPFRHHYGCEFNNTASEMGYDCRDAFYLKNIAKEIRALINPDQKKEGE